MKVMNRIFELIERSDPIHNGYDPVEQFTQLTLFASIEYSHETLARSINGLGDDIDTNIAIIQYKLLPHKYHSPFCYKSMYTLYHEIIVIYTVNNIYNTKSISEMRSACENIFMKITNISDEYLFADMIRSIVTNMMFRGECYRLLKFMESLLLYHYLHPDVHTDDVINYLSYMLHPLYEQWSDVFEKLGLRDYKYRNKSCYVENYIKDYESFEHRVISNIHDNHVMLPYV